MTRRFAGPASLGAEEWRRSPSTALFVVEICASVPLDTP